MKVYCAKIGTTLTFTPPLTSGDEVALLSFVKGDKVSEILDVVIIPNNNLNKAKVLYKDVHDDDFKQIAVVCNIDQCVIVEENDNIKSGKITLMRQNSLSIADNKAMDFVLIVSQEKDVKSKTLLSNDFFTSLSREYNSIKAKSLDPYNVYLRVQIDLVVEK